MAIYRRGAEGWHTDGAYDQEPFKATQLYALAVPSTGGDTLFASMYAAYDALPPRLKQRLEGRQGAFTYGGRRKATALLEPRGPRLDAGLPSDRPHASRRPDARRSTSTRARSSASKGSRRRRATR